MGDIERYSKLSPALRDDMENRFLWAASTGHDPQATIDGAVATIVDPLLDQLEGAVEAERARIVAWLRERAESRTFGRFRDVFRNAADDLERQGGQ